MFQPKISHDDLFKLLIFYSHLNSDLLKTLTCMPYTMYILRVPEYRTALTANNPTSYFGCTFFG